MSSGTDIEMHRQNLEKFANSLRGCASLDHKLVSEMATQIAHLSEQNVFMGELITRLEKHPSHHASVLCLIASRKYNLDVIDAFTAADSQRTDAFTAADLQRIDARPEFGSEAMSEKFYMRLDELHASNCNVSVANGAWRDGGVSEHCYGIAVDTYTMAIGEFVREANATRRGLCLYAAAIVRQPNL